MVRAVDFGFFAWLAVPLLRALKWIDGFILDPERWIKKGSWDDEPMLPPKLFPATDPNDDRMLETIRKAMA